MRKIKPSQILVFASLLTVAIVLSLLTTKLMLGGLPLGDFRGITLVVAAVGFLYIYALALYRWYLAWFPLLPGVYGGPQRQDIN